MTKKERVKYGFNHPQTHPHAWKKWKWRDIATAAGVSEHTAKRVLPGLVKDKHPEIDTYAKFKNYGTIIDDSRKHAWYSPHTHRSARRYFGACFSCQRFSYSKAVSYYNVY